MYSCKYYKLADWQERYGFAISDWHMAELNEIK